jgi:hypothetical protein
MLNRLIGYLKSFRDAIELQWVQGESLPNWLWRNRKCSRISPTEKVENPRCDLEHYIDRPYTCTESIKSK